MQSYAGDNCNKQNHDPSMDAMLVNELEAVGLALEYCFTNLEFTVTSRLVLICKVTENLFKTTKVDNNTLTFQHANLIVVVNVE